MLATDLPLYRQMMDPSLSGPATQIELDTFSAFNSLGIIAVRPILLALHQTPDCERGLSELLRLVVRRVVVGNLGTGNVERRLGEVALRITKSNSWAPLAEDLNDLNPSEEEFSHRLSRRTLNKNTLGFMRRSVTQMTTTPEDIGTLHFIWPRSSGNWSGFVEQDNYWRSTIGNTILLNLKRRPQEATEDWNALKATMLEAACDGEWIDELREKQEWSPASIEDIGKRFASAAAEVWY
jgi:hypothetical protein